MTDPKLEADIAQTRALLEDARRAVTSAQTSVDFWEALLEALEEEQQRVSYFKDTKPDPFPF